MGTTEGSKSCGSQQPFWRKDLGIKGKAGLTF